jgi:Flp pilus assembly protein TadG
MPRPRRSARSGNVAVEFGLIALPLMLLILGIIQFGSFLWYRQTLEAALATASQYVFSNTTQPIATIEAAIPAQVRAALTGLDPTQVTVTTSNKTDGNNVAFITITLTYPFTFLEVLGINPQLVTLTAGATIPVQ